MPGEGVIEFLLDQMEQREQLARGSHFKQKNDLLQVYSQSTHNTAYETGAQPTKHQGTFLQVRIFIPIIVLMRQ